MARVEAERRAMGSQVQLAVTDLHVYLYRGRTVGKAVRGVSLEIRKGETLGLVGESGSGKSMTALSIIGLHPQPGSRIVAGSVMFQGVDLVALPPERLRAYRGRHIASIFQDPMTALNPVLTVEDQLVETLKAHTALRGTGLRNRAIELLSLLRVPDARRRLKNYPHQFSGGMRQRVIAAIALASGPEVLIADEPTTALDVTVQAAFLALLREIQERMGLAILFITHDFGVVGRICDRVAVMYAGRIVESASVDDLLQRPAHPYTEALINAVPDLNAEVPNLKVVGGQPPSIYEIPAGCPFASRCPYAMPRCTEEYPDVTEVEPGHKVSCWKYL